MKWKKLTIETTTQAVDFISGLLAELGIEGIEVEDNVPLSEEDKEKMFIDILPELPEDDGTARVNCYLELDQDLEDTAARIQAGLEEFRTFVDVGTGHISFDETEDKDWMNNWKEFFKPFRVDDSIVIKPTWEKLENSCPDDLIVEIDPGTAFGTGAHETTKLCIGNLKKYLKEGDALLDVGCGSGILSIIGMKLGAGCAVGTDIDANAVETAKENAQINHLHLHTSKMETECPSGTVEFLTGNVIGDNTFAKQVGENCYQVVVANILADVIIPLSATVKKHMAEGAYFISSGIIDMKADEVKEALNANGFEIVEEARMKDWVSFVAKIKE
ncbi:MAG: 50S ribosomal protein L11 methyltransferase [Lachnospiraceae bacterium]|jgi:ribosomal protein L11 methyltransferase|nr:50S ribosomal protein L11 methyltransferase [Lachnospiraceae bacterium]